MAKKSSSLSAALMILNRYVFPDSTSKAYVSEHDNQCTRISNGNVKTVYAL